MSTAHRPCFDSIKGKSNSASSAKRGIVSVYDLPSETTMKLRPEISDVKKTRLELENELLIRESQHKGVPPPSTLLSITSTITEDSVAERVPFSFVSADIAALDQDCDDYQAENNGTVSHDDRSSDDSEDEEMMLMMELEKIKREREEQRQREADAEELAERERKESLAMVWNPLETKIRSNNSQLDFSVRRRWDDDVLFKNCATTKAQAIEKQFINDPVRNDFHKSFLNKYMQ